MIAMALLACWFLYGVGSVLSCMKSNNTHTYHFWLLGGRARRRAERTVASLLVAYPRGRAAPRTRPRRPAVSRDPPCTPLVRNGRIRNGAGYTRLYELIYVDRGRTTARVPRVILRSEVRRVADISKNRRCVPTMVGRAQRTRKFCARQPFLIGENGLSSAPYRLSAHSGVRKPGMLPSLLRTLSEWRLKRSAGLG